MIATHPSEVVAEGAAIQAQFRLNYKRKDYDFELSSEDFVTCDPTVVNEYGVLIGFTAPGAGRERRAYPIGERSENSCEG